MQIWQAMLCCFAIAFGAVFIFEVIKCVIKYIMKKKGKVLNMNKAEYPLALLSLTFTFGGIFLFLYYGKYIPLTLNQILTISGVFAGSSQAIYMFLLQAPKKGILWVINSIKTIIHKFSGKDSFDDIKDTVDEVVGDMKDDGEINNSFNNTNKIDLSIDEQIAEFRNSLKK